MKTVASYNISSHNALLVSLIILGIIFDGQLFGVLQILVAILKHLTTIIVSVFLDMYCITIPTIVQRVMRFRQQKRSLYAAFPNKK